MKYYSFLYVDTSGVTHSETYKSTDLNTATSLLKHPVKERLALRVSAKDPGPDTWEWLNGRTQLVFPTGDDKPSCPHDWGNIQDDWNGVYKCKKCGAYSA